MGIKGVGLTEGATTVPENLVIRLAVLSEVGSRKMFALVDSQNRTESKTNRVEDTHFLVSCSEP